MNKIAKIVFIFSFLFPGILLAGEGHKAGRRWAERKGIDDPDDCRSRDAGKWEDDNINNSSSFTKGCLEHLRDENLIDDLDNLKEEEDSDDDQDSEE